LQCTWWHNQAAACRHASENIAAAVNLHNMHMLDGLQVLPSLWLVLVASLAALHWCVLALPHPSSKPC
jgi:hypothetical protein